jgi:hypothetical protein
VPGLYSVRKHHARQREGFAVTKVGIAYVKSLVVCALFSACMTIIMLFGADPIIAASGSGSILGLGKILMMAWKKS